jgi:hypothetical protein
MTEHRRGERPAAAMTTASAFAAEIAEHFSPSVAVACDHGAQSTLSASGISFVDVLRICSDRAGVGPQGTRSSWSAPEAMFAARAWLLHLTFRHRRIPVSCREGYRPAGGALQSPVF